MRISDWSSDVCSSDLLGATLQRAFAFYATQTRDLRFELHAYGELAAIELHAAHPQCDPQGFLNEWWFMLWSHLAGWLIGEEIPVVAADFSHALAGRPEIGRAECRERGVTDGL